MKLLRNLQAQVAGKSRRAKARGEKVESAPVIDNYVEDGFVTREVWKADCKAEKSRGGTGYTHGSSLINMCARKHALMALLGSGYKPVRSADRLLWAIGRAVEKHIRTAFIGQVKGAGVIGVWSCRCGKTTDTGFCPSVKIKCSCCGLKLSSYGELTVFDHENRIVGNPDLLYARPDTNKVRVNEIKSMNKKDFDSLTTPKGDHVWQGLIYRRLLEINDVDVDDSVAIIYGCKDYSFKGSPYKEYTVKVTKQHEENLDRMWEKAGVVAEFVAALKLGEETKEMSKHQKPLPSRIPQCSAATTTTAKGCDQCSACFSLKQ